MLKRGLMLGVAAMLALAVSVPSSAALTVRAVIVISTGQTVVLNTPAFTYIPSPGDTPLKAKVVCLKRVKTTHLGPGLDSNYTYVHAVKGLKNYYFSFSSVPSRSPVQVVNSAIVAGTPRGSESDNCNAPIIPEVAVGVAVFG